MVPTPRSHHGGNRAKPTLEILPDARFVVFHGSEHEASSVKLTGRVRLTTPEPMSILKPKVRLEGKRKISWWFMGGISAGEVVDKRVFWNQEQKMGIESAHKVKAGSIEWPFEFELDPSMPESVEGLRETFIVYHLHASVSRPGWNAKDLLAQEHIRIVRTLGQDSMEMTRSRVNADIWANKISYSISIPTDAVVFGTSITADVELSPIKKGIRLGKVEMRLVETIVKRIQASEVPDIRGDRQKSEEAEVAKVDMDFPEQSRIMYDEETTENPMMADEMYKFKATLPLPKSLNVCRQDVDTHQINITHRFKLMVNIHNPEGHISQLVCRLPVKLFISPNLPVDESNEVSGVLNGATDEELNNTEATLVAPPEYGRHLLDQMYSDIDPSGFMSRAGSASGTPYGIMAQSRRGSIENLPSLNGIADRDHGSATPGLLHSRLADLQLRGNGAQNPSTRHSPSGGTSPAPADLDPLDHSPIPGSTLSRVPSYAAAVRTPGHITPYVDGPPSYIDATSRPPSPHQPGSPPSGFHTSTSPPSEDSGFSPIPGLIARPDTVHLRTNTSTPTSSPPPGYSQGVIQTQQNVSSSPLHTMSLSTVGEEDAAQQQQQQQQEQPSQRDVSPQPLPVLAHRSRSSAHEDEARLRMLRARS
ncbi:hypothetical protein K431DRAFT_230936 [Polychaeton citri CBS 116435]|uniref:Arrestin C-terminal-like domain-containing protein n=1 Tax=Polychaeton citri CBS 116435 TaxID=1314669 RepID=A0A9P4ULE1_9PEZI|nr:hypothetical protein K431DRAFT_230936 [Polychaeton citri CBS 116435]